MVNLLLLASAKQFDNSRITVQQLAKFVYLFEYKGYTPSTIKDTEGPLSREDEAVLRTNIGLDTKTIIVFGQVGAIRMILKPFSLILCKMLWRR
jgi:hypothetical protein